VTAAPDEAFVFNIVWTGKVFTYLQYFVASQIAQSGARFRFVVNGCPPEQIAMMEAFRERRPDRVLDVLVACDKMEAHGVALDIAYDRHDDGEFFCFIDPDILAEGPFLGDFADRLDQGCAGVTSGQGVWRDDSVLPEGQLGVSGEYFYAPDGYLFGSPHFAMYRRDALDPARAQWGVGFRSAGPDVSEAGAARLEAIGRKYWIYDTGKIMNIFLQDGGAKLCHFEHPNLIHIGGMSHYLSPPDGGGAADDAGWEPDQRIWPWPVTRLEVARYTAVVLRNLTEGRPAPELPAEVDAALASRLNRVRDALVGLVAAYQKDVVTA
jgi:hypothetical protein